MSAGLHSLPWPFPATSAGRRSAPEGWPPEAMAHALARAATEGCRVDALRIRGRVRDVFVALDVDGMVYVHVIAQPYPRRATRLHALLRMGKRNSADIDARALVRYLKAQDEVELRGADLRVYGGGVCLENPPTHFELLHPWLAQVWPVVPSPKPSISTALTTEPPASTAREAA